MEFLTNISSFHIIFILYLGTKNSALVMKFSEDIKLGNIINGKKFCSFEDLGFLVFYLQLPVDVLHCMYQLRSWLRNYTKSYDIKATKRKGQVGIDGVLNQ